MSESRNKPGTGFWVISIIALIWNLMGILNYIVQAYMTDDMKALLEEGQR
jgi:hypothetical protein